MILLVFKLACYDNLPLKPFLLILFFHSLSSLLVQHHHLLIALPSLILSLQIELLLFLLFDFTLGFYDVLLLFSTLLCHPDEIEPVILSGLLVNLTPFVFERAFYKRVLHLLFFILLGNELLAELFIANSHLFDLLEI